MAVAVPETLLSSEVGVQEKVGGQLYAQYSITTLLRVGVV